MALDIALEPEFDAAAYATVSIAFEVRERLAVSAPDAGLAGLHLSVERVRSPYVKDYDADPANHPTAWTRRFDVSRWGVLAACEARGPGVGAALFPPP